MQSLLEASRILIIWRHPLFRAVTTAILQDVGVQSISAASLDGAQEAIRTLHPDFLLIEDEWPASWAFDQIDVDLNVLAFTMDRDDTRYYRYMHWRGIDKEQLARIIQTSLRNGVDSVFSQ